MGSLITFYIHWLWLCLEFLFNLKSHDLLRIHQLPGFVRRLRMDQRTLDWEKTQNGNGCGCFLTLHKPQLYSLTLSIYSLLIRWCWVALLYCAQLMKRLHVWSWSTVLSWWERECCHKPGQHHVTSLLWCFNSIWMFLKFVSITGHKGHWCYATNVLLCWEPLRTPNLLIEPGCYCHIFQTYVS